MILIISAAVAAVCATICVSMAIKTRRLLKRMEEIRKNMKGVQDFWDWGKNTQIVVRNKVTHEDVVNINALVLFMEFHMGRAFRNAHLLFDNNEFKVYAHHTPKE